MAFTSGARFPCAVVLFWCSFAGALIRAAEAPLPWSSDLSTELVQARADGRPIVVLVRDPRDLAALDAGHWLTEDPALNDALKGFHRVLLWDDSLQAGRLGAATPGRLLVMNSQGELLTRPEIPLRRAPLPSLLSAASQMTQPLERLAAEARANPQDLELLRRCCEALLVSGYGQRAAELLARPEAQNLAQDLATEHSVDLKDRLQGVREALNVPQRQQVGTQTQQMAERLERLEAKVRLYRVWTRVWLSPPLAEEFLRAAPLLATAASGFDMDHKVFLERIKRDAPASRAAALACLTLGFAAQRQAGLDAAKDYWKAAEKMADGGESPALFRAARSLRWLAEGKDTPRRTRWAKREVLDVVVLVPDLPTFAEAVSCWTDKTFFPVLFQDDLYAPKFVAAFKPAQVLSLPPSPAGMGALTLADLRRVLLHSWTKPDDRGKWPAVPGDEALRARLDDLDGATGVVFTKEASDELAGALALAAGRFQGLEVLPTTGTLRPSLTDARAMARWVEEALRRWGLPREERTAFVTLAGKYPLVYRGLPYGSTGNVYALDDLLGRAEDTARLAVTGRLTGGAAGSAYQAACSLFLKPDSAALVDAWTKEGPGWDEYHLTETDRAWGENLRVTCHHGAGAREAYRAQCGLWNRGCRISLLQTGGGATALTPEDLAAGEPSLVILTQPGAADEPGDADTLRGRALWGGAFWCLGAVGEPFLQGFQPVSFYAEPLARGAAFAVALRRYAGQPFAWPWRVAVFGDPQFCLREKPAKRKAWKPQDGPLVREGEIVLRGPAPAPASASYADWLAELRRARWRGDREAAGQLAVQAPASAKLDAAGLALVLEEDLRTGAASDAWKLWAAAPDEARRALAPRLCARQAACFLLDRALSAQELENALVALDAVLLTGPAPESAGRWLDRTAALARKLDRVPPFAAWLAARAEDASLKGYREVFHERIRRLGGEVLNGNGKGSGR